MVGWEKSEAGGVKMNRKSSNTAFWNLSRDIWVREFSRKSSLYVNGVQKKKNLYFERFYLSLYRKIKIFLYFKSFSLACQRKIGKMVLCHPSAQQILVAFLPSRIKRKLLGSCKVLVVSQAISRDMRASLVHSISEGS